MRILACITVALAALFAAAAGPASAQYLSGPGFGVYVGPRHDRGYYEERRYRRHYDDRYRGYGRYHRRGLYDERTGQTYYRPRRGHCPPHYTVQDGLCKPYRGY